MYSARMGAPRACACSKLSRQRAPAQQCMDVAQGQQVDLLDCSRCSHTHRHYWYKREQCQHGSGAHPSLKAVSLPARGVQKKTMLKQRSQVIGAASSSDLLLFDQ